MLVFTRTSIHQHYIIILKSKILFFFIALLVGYLFLLATVPYYTVSLGFEDNVTNTCTCIYYVLFLFSNETNIPQQTIDGSKITAKQQPTNHCNFHILTTNNTTTKLTNQNHNQRHKYQYLMTTLLLTLKMTTAQVVEMSVTNNSLSKEYLHPDDHAQEITDTPGFKPFTICSCVGIFPFYSHLFCHLFDI